MKKTKKKNQPKSKNSTPITKIWSILKKILGVFLIIVGIIGLFLPLLQGILLIFIGITLFQNKKIKECVQFWINKTKRLKKGEKISFKEIFRA